jgi:hypothetical protein
LISPRVLAVAGLGKAGAPPYDPGALRLQSDIPERGAA